METKSPSFRLKTETATKPEPRLHQVDMFPQWYEQYVVNETPDPIPMPPKYAPFNIRAWWHH